MKPNYDNQATDYYAQRVERLKALQNRLSTINDAREEHDGTAPFIEVQQGYLSGFPYTFSSDVHRAFVFRDDAQAQSVIDEFSDILPKAVIRHVFKKR